MTASDATPTPASAAKGEDIRAERAGWFIREKGGRWTFTDKRIAAVAALTEGYEVCPTAALHPSSAADAKPVAWRVRLTLPGYPSFLGVPMTPPEPRGGEVIDCFDCGHVSGNKHHATCALEGRIPFRRPSSPGGGGRPSREAVATLIWERFAPSSDMEPENALRGEYVLVADAILALFPPVAGWRPTHRHRGGMECEVIGEAQVQTVTGLCDYDAVTVYREEDGTMWVRGKSEFEDGRFTPLPAAPDHIGETSFQIGGRSHETICAVRKVANSSVAVCAQQPSDPVRFVTVIDVEALPAPAGVFTFTDGTAAALLGEHLVVIRNGDPAKPPEVVFSGFASGAVSQDASSCFGGVGHGPPLRGSVALITAVASDSLRVLFEGKVVDGKALSAAVASQCFHDAINEMICRNDQANEMVRDQTDGVGG